MARSFESRFGAGLSLRRLDDARLVSGRGLYAANFPADLRAAFVRSPYPHARIVSICVDEALRAPGVHAVLTGRDLIEAGVSPFPYLKVVDRPDGAPMASPSRWPLAVEEVCYVGDPVALIIAEDVEQAKSAAEAVYIEYEELPHVIDPTEALEPGSARTSEELPDNLSGEFRLGDPDAVDAIVASAPHVTRLRLLNNRVAVNPMELRSVVASYDDSEGFTWRGATQTPHLSQQILSEVLGVPEDRVHVLVGDVGGAFGARIVPYPEDGALLCAARHLRRSVKWQCDRSELFLSDTHARDHISDCTLALDEAGRILAARFHVIANLGAHVSYFGGNAPTHTGNRVSTGVYDIPQIDVQVRAVLTNTVSTAPYRGAGRPEAIYRLERTLDLAAAELGIDPAEIRRRNLVNKDQMPYSAASGALYDSGDFSSVLERALELSEADSLPARRGNAQQCGVLYGRGIACHIDTTSSLVPSETVRVAYTHNGLLEIYSGVQEMGQGLRATFAQMASARLRLPLQATKVVFGDTVAVTDKGHGSYGSRSLYIAGSALALALEELTLRGSAVVAGHLGIEAGKVTEVNGAFSVTGGRSFSLADVVALTGEMKLEASATFEAQNCYPSGCHICEVAVDPDTGFVHVARFVAVDDVGTVMNPDIVHGQAKGGIVQGIGQAIWENCRYDESGQLSSGSFMDYAMPRASDCPEIVVEFMPTASPTNPLGIKGAGESGAIGAPPAVVNAVIDALRPYGIRHLDMPLHPNKVWSAIKAAGKVND